MEEIIKQLEEARKACEALDTWPGKKAAAKIGGAIEILSTEGEIATVETK